MISRKTFAVWVEEALKKHGGKASILEVSKHVWINHENELRKHEETFYKWQYDVR